MPADDEHKTYALTENGVEIAKQLDSILAYSIKEKAYACAVKLLAVKKNEIENKVDIVKIQTDLLLNVRCPAVIWI